MNNYPPQSVSEFRIQNKADENEFSDWYILPGNQLFLNYYSGKNIAGFTEKELGLPESAHLMEVCIVFNADGTNIHNFTR